MKRNKQLLTLIRVDFLGVRFVVWWEGLKTWNLVLKYTHTYVVSENKPFSIKTSLILQMSAFFAKNSTFTQSNSMRAVLEIF